MNKTKWFKIRHAIRAEYRLESLSTSSYLEVVFKDKILIADKGFYRVDENDIPTPIDLVVLVNLKYILAISDRLYEAKDCDVAILPSVVLSSLRKRLSELPTLGLPKFLIGLPDFEYEKKNEMLYFYIPKNLYVKDKDTQNEVKREILPRIILDYSLNDDKRFYDNSYPLPYVKRFKFHSYTFFVNTDFDYIVCEKDRGDYKIYHLPTEIPTHEFNFTINEQRIDCARKTLEERGLTRLKLSLENEKVKVEV